MANVDWRIVDTIKDDGTLELSFRNVGQRHDVSYSPSNNKLCVSGELLFKNILHIIGNSDIEPIHI